MVFDLIFKGLMLFGYEPICFDFHIGTSNGNNKKMINLFYLLVCIYFNWMLVEKL